MDYTNQLSVKETAIQNEKPGLRPSLWHNTLHNKVLFPYNGRMKPTDYEKWLSQFRKGFLELCVLVVLRQIKSSYGFELLQIFKNSGLDINEGTLYPLLNRMQKNSWLTSNWETPIDKGHPRRFYQLSVKGKELLISMLKSNEQNQQTLNLLKNLK